MNKKSQVPKAHGCSITHTPPGKKNRGDERKTGATKRISNLAKVTLSENNRLAFRSKCPAPSWSWDFFGASASPAQDPEHSGVRGERALSSGDRKLLSTISLWLQRGHLKMYILTQTWFTSSFLLQKVELKYTQSFPLPWHSVLLSSLPPMTGISPLQMFLLEKPCLVPELLL